MEVEKELILMIGAWRNGIDDYTKTFVEEALDNRKKGLRQLSYELTVVTLIDLLDAYESLTPELLLHNQMADETEEIPPVPLAPKKVKPA